jgi:tetratricopeptide (TPR) repeat protein
MPLVLFDGVCAVDSAEIVGAGGMAIQPEHRSILVVDIEGFSRSERTTPIQRDLHHHLHRLLQDVLHASGISRRACEWEDRGDGFLVTISPQVPKSRLLDPLIPLLAERLQQWNANAEPAWQLRLRMVVDAGEVLRDPKANVGEAVVAACRLLDAPQLRACLTETTRPLVVAVSSWIYQQVIRHRYGQIDPAVYWPMVFTGKGMTGQAWVQVPGDPDAPVRAGITARPPPGMPDRRSGAAGSALEPRAADAQEEAAIPVDLPADVVSFTGRSEELETLRRLFADASRRPRSGLIVVSALAGKGGIGKTALAVHAAYQLQDHFPDGQLYVNLRGAERQALQPADVLAQLLRALGIPSALIPEDVDERARLYRRRLTTRRVLIVLDNAADEAQIRPLLPGGGSSAVLITSRKQLAGLDTAANIRLDVLQPADAIALLGKLAGRARVEEEPEAAESIARWCGYLPLAVRIAGAKLHAKPHLPLRRFAQQLADQRRRLDTLQVGDLDLRASFALSYRQLPAEQRRLFRLLGLLEVADFPAWVAAALLDCPIDHAADLTEQLVDAQLLEATGEDAVGQLRYRFHDLLRVFARERAERGEPRVRRKAALQRALGGYLSLAATATGVLDRGRQHLTSRIEADRWTVSDPGAAATAHERPVEWFTIERANLLTAIEQAHQQHRWAMTWELADSLASFLDRGGYWHDRRRTSELGLDAARRAGDRSWQAKMLYYLGNVRSDQACWQEALAIFEQARAIYHQLGDTYGLACIGLAFGLLFRRLGRLDDAMAQYQQSLWVFTEVGDRSQQSFVHIGMADIHQARGHLDDAAAHIQRALPVHQQEGNLIGEVFALNDLGAIARSRGDLGASLQYLQQSLEVATRIGSRLWTARTLVALAATYREQAKHQQATGDREQATSALERAMRLFDDALVIFQDLGDRRSEAMLLLERSDALLLLDVRDIHERRRLLEEAMACTDRCLAVFREIGDRFWAAKALQQKSKILTAQGRHHDARGWRQQAQQAFRALA